MPNLFEHFATSAAYVHKILFIKIVQASEMPNLFEHFTMSEAYVHEIFLETETGTLKFVPPLNTVKFHSINSVPTWRQLSAFLVLL